MATLQENVNRLFQDRNIKQVIYVDDFYGKDSFSEPVIEFLRQNYGTDGLDWQFDIEPNIEVAIANCRLWMFNVDEFQLKKWCNNHGIECTKSIEECRLSEALPMGVLQCLSPAQFKTEYIDNPINTLSKDHQILILMDKYIEPEDPQSGMRLLNTFKNVDYVSCGLFSNTFHPNQEIERWIDCERANNVFPLSKERLNQENLEDLLQGLTNVVWLRQISDIKQKVCDLFQDSLNNAKNVLCQLDPQSFDSAIIKTSSREGCWEFETLKRIYLLLIDLFMQKALINEGNFVDIQNYTKVLKSICSFHMDSPMELSRQLRDLRKSEVYDDIEYLNKTFSQISNGDIFDVSGNKYMLVCQPCNLMLRGDASRNAKEFVYLLPIEEVFIPTNLEDESQKKKCRRQTYISHLLQINGESLYCVNLGSAKRISPKVLDLVCFNESGLATINLNHDRDTLPNASLMQENMLKHYHNIYCTLKNHVSVCQSISNDRQLSREDKAYIMKILKRPFELSTEKFVSAEFDVDNNLLEFGLKRVGRYKDPYVQIILQNFMDYQSRQAFPHDFSRI